MSGAVLTLVSVLIEQCLTKSGNAFIALLVFWLANLITH